MNKEIKTTSAPQAVGPYSQAIIAGNFVFTSGYVHLTPEGTLVEGTIEEKTRQVMKNLSAVLKASGVSFKNVVKTTMYITDYSLFNRINTVYAGFMIMPYPARETVVVKELPKGADVEISMIAIKD